MLLHIFLLIFNDFLYLVSEIRNLLLLEYILHEKLPYFVGLELETSCTPLCNLHNVPICVLYSQSLIVNIMYYYPIQVMCKLLYLWQVMLKKITAAEADLLFHTCINTYVYMRFHIKGTKNNYHKKVSDETFVGIFTERVNHFIF